MQASIRTHATATKREAMTKTRRHRRSQLARLLGQRSKRCWCVRCTLARTGVYRRVRTQNETAIRIDIRVLGIRVHRRTVPLGG